MKKGGIRRGGEPAMAAGIVSTQTLVNWKDNTIRIGNCLEESIQEMALLQMKYFVKSFGQ
jgi:hypothetical protein